MRGSRRPARTRRLVTDAGDQLVELAATAPLVEVLKAGRGLANDHAGTTNLHGRDGVDALLDAWWVPLARFDRPCS